uniref:Uncharacterized protein n=1 Tax=Haplochromis burtoni TaxID=8153 RepID=A0A3Q2UZB3_HAPBU
MLEFKKKKKQIKTKTRKTDKGKKKERKKGGRGTETKYGESWRGKKRTGVKAPLMFSIQNLCKTPVSRTQRSRIVSDGVKGEVFKVRHEQPYQPPQHGPDPCKDAVPWSRSSRSLLLNMKPTNGYLLCLFWVGFSKKHTNELRKTTCAYQWSVNDLKKAVNKETKKVFSCICPLHDVPIRKFKTAFHMLCKVITQTFTPMRGPNLQGWGEWSGDPCSAGICSYKGYRSSTRSLGLHLLLCPS